MLLKAQFIQGLLRRLRISAHKHGEHIIAIMCLRA